MSLQEIQYERMLVAVAAEHERIREKQVMVSFAEKGRQYEHQLMVIGRAVYGGNDDDMCIPESWSSAETRRANLEHAKMKITDQPLQWVADSFQARRDESGNKLYSTRNSAFWRVIHRVMSDMAIIAGGSQWPTQLVWTNLYKVAPLSAGNPLAKLQNVQRSVCGDILRGEISAYTPKRLLFLTGADWFHPFADVLGFADEGHSNGKFVQGAGRISSDDNRASVVVARHPQGKPETAFVSEVTVAFARLELAGA
jgi:hypothetical protein